MMLCARNSFRIRWYTRRKGNERVFFPHAAPLGNASRTAPVQKRIMSSRYCFPCTRFLFFRRRWIPISPSNYYEVLEKLSFYRSRLWMFQTGAACRSIVPCSSMKLMISWKTAAKMLLANIYCRPDCVIVKIICGGMYSPATSWKPCVDSSRSQPHVVVYRLCYVLKDVCGDMSPAKLCVTPTNHFVLL